MADASSVLEAGEVSICAPQMNLDREAPTSAEKKMPATGFDRFLATLSFPTPEEQELFIQRIDRVKAEWKKWTNAPDNSGIKRPSSPSPRDIFEGRDPETRDLVVKEANFVLRELGPQVIGNIEKMLDEIPDIDGARGTEEFFEKRSADLKTLLSFNFMPKDRPVNAQEERQLRYALSLIYFMTDSYVVNQRAEGGMYELGLDRLTQRLRKDPTYTHAEEAQRPKVVELLGRQAIQVHDAIGRNFGFGEEDLPRRGLIDGISGDYEKLTYYARRVDPQFYLDLEDNMMGLDPSKPKVEPQPAEPIRVS